MSPSSILPTDRRDLLKLAGLMAGAAGLGIDRAMAQTQPPTVQHAGGLRRGMLSYMLASEQFPTPELVHLGALASRSGFHVLSTSDHFQPWQANEGHVGQAWVTMGALGGQSHGIMGTTVTCPTLRYNPAVVAEAFATLGSLYPNRVFLGVGSGEALNEQAATGEWPKWQERWDRLIEAITVIRQMWSGQDVAFKGKYYNVSAKLYDAPKAPIPLLTAANGKKSMRLAGQYGDGLISDPESWHKYKTEWEEGARAAGKNPATMPVLIEQYVVVGDQKAAQQAGEYWRFGPKAWRQFFNNPNPADIQQKAEANTPMDEVLKSWAVGTDPAVHTKKIHELFESGVSVVNIHSGQPDQTKVIEFFGKEVLPKVRV